MKLLQVYLCVAFFFCSSLLFAHSGDTLFVPYGSMPTIDGQISPGEWDDADTVLVASLPEGPAVIYYKQSPDSLYIAIELPDGTYNDFDNASIYFDTDHDGGSAPQTDDFGCGSHRGGMLVEFVGTGSGWVQDSIDGWNAALTSTSTYWQVEYSVSFGKLAIVQGVAKTIGFETRVGDNGNGSANWPAGASNGNPNTWADIVSPDNWSSPDSIPPNVQVIDPNGGEVLTVGNLYPILWFAEDLNGIDSINIYYSTDAGGSWIPVSSGEANDSVYLWDVPNTPSDSCLVRIIAFDPSMNSEQDESDSLFTIAAVGTEERRIKGDSEKGLSVTVFPEPFAERTAIDLYLAKNTQVNLSIYDISGRKILNLFDGVLRKGHQEFLWNGQDSNGKAACTGIYIIRIEAAEGVYTRRITILR